MMPFFFLNYSLHAVCLIFLFVFLILQAITAGKYFSCVLFLRREMNSSVGMKKPTIPVQRRVDCTTRAS